MTLFKETIPEPSSTESGSSTENTNIRAKKTRSIEERVSSLPEQLKTTLERLSQEGNIEEFFNNLSEYGISLSEQQEYASHFMREFKEGLKIISWTKERLMYTVAFLEHTLASENPNLSSVENMIRNYLIFSKIFKGQEGSILRFGQFNYVIRGIFKGVKTREDIFRIIQDHKTFGEATITREEAEKFIDEQSGIIDGFNREFSEKMEKSAGRLKDLKKTIKETAQEEEQSKGLVWSTSYTPPQEYEFPNYVFQTGNRRGLNTAIGRSSWEVMFLAFSDVINKMMEDRVGQRTDLSGEQKQEVIKKRRIELLYEPFDFPIGIKKDREGKERLIIYRPDFIDINRWGVIEIKGPLTPEAREKIRAFQKYYIDQDFSDLPEDQQIIMMRCIVDKMEEIRNWCKQNGYPVYDQFNDFQVFGAYRWDRGLNNFNRYDGAEEMRGLSERTKESLQKGLIKFIEEQVEKGKYPDIRPRGYIKTGDLDGVIKNNKEQAKERGQRYNVEKMYQTKPYLPRVVLKEIEEILTTKPEIRLVGENIRKIISYVLDTLPVSQEVKKRILDIQTIRETLEYINSGIGRITQRDFLLLRDGHKVEIKSHEAGYDIGAVIQKLKDIREELLYKKKSGQLKTANEKEFGSQMAHIKRMIEAFKKNFDKVRKNLVLEYDFFTISKQSQTKDQGLINIYEYLERLFLGKYYFLFDDRLSEILDLYTEKISRDESDKGYTTEKLLHIAEKEIILPIDFCHTSDLIARKILKEFNLNGKLIKFVSLFIYLKESPFLPQSSAINYLTDELCKSFVSPEDVIKCLDGVGPHFSRDSFLNVLKMLFSNKDRSQVDIERVNEMREKMFQNKESLISILELMIKSSLGDRYQEFYKLLVSELDTPLIRQIKRKVYNIPESEKYFY